MFLPTVTKVATISFACIILCSCKTFFVAGSDGDRIDTSEQQKLDEGVDRLVEPYRSELETSMNVVVAELEVDMSKEKPECNLGNHVAEITHWAAEKATGLAVDFSVMNYGGLRVPTVNRGPLMVKDAYQIMPFDNYIVIMELDGETVQALMDRLAANGGWPVANLSMVIDGEKAVEIRIGGKDLDPERTYLMAISDYLASGGDRLDLLKSIPHNNTGILLRDAIIDAWKTSTARGEKVSASKDGRVTIKQ